MGSLEDNDANMEIENIDNNIKEESKSQSRQSLGEDQNYEFEASLNQASFGQTLEWTSTLQKDARQYKSFHNESLLMTMENPHQRVGLIRRPDDMVQLPKYPTIEKKVNELSRNHSDNTPNTQIRNKIINIVPARRRPKLVGLSKFFEKNDIKSQIQTVGRGKNIRFGPEGVYRVNRTKLKDVKKKQEETLDKQRKIARNKTFMKNRQLGDKNNQQLDIEALDLIDPLQSIVMLNSSIASSLFYNLFDNLYTLESSEEVRQELADMAIKITSESVSCDNATISSFLLILLKL